MIVFMTNLFKRIEALEFAYFPHVRHGYDYQFGVINSKGKCASWEADFRKLPIEPPLKPLGGSRGALGDPTKMTEYMALGMFIL